MIPFTLGVVIVFAGLMGALLGLEPSVRWYEDRDIVLLIARSIAAPAFAAWIVAELVNVLRPLRVFDRRIARFAPRLACGLIAGLIGAGAASVLLSVADGFVHDVVILSSAATAGTVLALGTRRRVRRGRCIHCEYDVRSQPGPGMPGWRICPECGASVMARREGSGRAIRVVAPMESVIATCAR